MSSGKIWSEYGAEKRIHSTLGTAGGFYQKPVRAIPFILSKSNLDKPNGKVFKGGKISRPFTKKLFRIESTIGMIETLLDVLLN